MRHHRGDIEHPSEAFDSPADLVEWSLHCFCLGARSTPHAIVRADDKRSAAARRPAKRWRKAGANLVPDGANCQQLLLARGVTADERTAAVIVAHELIWSIAEEMMAAGLFVLPPEGNLDALLLLTAG